MSPKSKPLLKWVGGKGQMLPALARYLPDRIGRYVEPMIGGGALFFAVAPEHSLIADGNPELINLYRMVVDKCDAVIEQYAAWPFDEKTFYELRECRFEDLEPVVAAARLLYLNRACFNGLYRVNRDGLFNVPWGRYKKKFNPDPAQLASARAALSKARIELADFRDLLESEAQPGDFVFLDPPYVPIAAYSDFKRYTRNQFHNADHEDMAALVRRLSERGCELIITNSNHPLVHDLYRGYEIEIVATRRNVNSRSNRRTGEDVIIHVPPAN